MERAVLVYRSESGPEEIVVERKGPACRLTRGGRVERAELAALGDGRLSLVFEDGRQVCGRVLPAGIGAVAVAVRGANRKLDLAEPLRDRLAHSSDHAPGEDEEKEVRAPMPGRVLEVAVHPGDRVEAGALLLVLEAMKMQNEIRAEGVGIVGKIEVASAEAVEGGTLMMTIRPVGPAPYSRNLN
jgi:biotin carboxyl carrier protein